MIFDLLPWILLTILAYMVINKRAPKQKETTQEQRYQDTPILDNPSKNYSNSYQRKYLLTKNEYHEYKKLKYHADKLGFQICPKVRLLDLIEPRRGEGFMSALGKIQSKHVDFVICDQNLYIKAIVELDDKSHDQPDRQERDRFVDDVLTSVGYTVIRTRAVTEDTLLSLAQHVGNTETVCFGE
jgi:hypothetical protein